MPFSQIIGHEKQLSALRTSLKTDRLHHAYLFVGPEGVGKRTLAMALAMALQCGRANEDSCGECEDCRRIAHGNHPDVRCIGTLEDKKEIGIQQIRHLEKEIVLEPFSGKRKIFVIDPADRLNYHAQSSLLKTLEEPPGQSLLLLIANGAGNLLPTLQSRCLRVPFGFLPTEMVTKYLVDRKGMPLDRAMALASVTMGSLGEAISADQEYLLGQRKEWIERVCSLEADDVRGMLSLAEEIAGDREKSVDFLQWMEAWFRDRLIYEVDGSTEKIRNSDMLAQLKKHVGQSDLHTLISTIMTVSRLARALEKNYNRRMVLESFILNTQTRC